MAALAPATRIALVLVVYLAQHACVNFGTPGPQDAGTVPTGTTAPTPAPTDTAAVGLTPVATLPPPATTPAATTPAAAAPAANTNVVVGGVVPPATAPVTTTPVPTAGSPSAVEPQGLARYTLVGRMVTRDPNAIQMAFMGSKIGAAFTGTSLSVVLSDTGTDGFNIVIDGGAPYVLYTKPISTNVTYPITTSLSPGLHTVWMTKRTEFAQRRNDAFVGQTTFLGFVLAPGEKFSTPPAAKTRRIEVIGDSSTSGYAVETNYVPGTPGCDYSALTQNADKALPAALARLLGAEYTNLSYTGEGIYHSAYDNNASHYLPVIWTQVLAPLANPAHDFTPQMDVVIIAAGGNDLDGASGSGTLPNPQAFVTTYANWLAAIRGKYPKALIVATLNPAASGTDRPTLAAAISQAVSQAQASLGNDANVVYFDYFANDPNHWQNYADAVQALNLGYACQYHPSPAGAEFLAARLAKFIAPRLGW